MIFARIKLWLLGAFSFLAVLAVAFFKGTQSAKGKINKQQLENYKDTRERIDEANSVTRDADLAREWLRDRRK